MAITDVLMTGKENAIKREQLSTMLNMSDRAVRKMIAEARDQGALIMNAQDGAGYYLSEDVKELQRQYKTNRARALSILRQQKYLRQKIKELEQQNQITIEEMRGKENA